MATITKTAARKPLANGRLIKGWNSAAGSRTFKFSLAGEETENGASRYLHLNLSEDEARDVRDYLIEQLRG
jgi:hypothetical protein